MASRQDIRRSRTRRRERSRILVVCEGVLSEVQYMQGLAQHLRASGLAVRGLTVKGVGRDPGRVLAEALRLRDSEGGDFDSAWILVDVDAHSTLDKCLVDAARAGVVAVVSNPCFEVWLLWHFEDLDAEQSVDWLRRRLRSLGQDGKAISASFPFVAIDDAVRRGTEAKRLVKKGTRGPNPSSAMPAVVERLRP